MDAHNNPITITGLSAAELARLEAYCAHRQAEHTAVKQAYGWESSDLTLDDAAYFLLMQALIAWEAAQAAALPREDA